MLQNRAVSSPLSSTAPPGIAGSLERTLSNERLQILKRTFSLPDSLQSFLIFLLLLLLICGALFAHLLLSTTIHQSELQLVELKNLNQQIVRESTVLIEQIAQESSLQRGMERVREQGYVVAYERHYLAQPLPFAPNSGRLQDQSATEAGASGEPGGSLPVQQRNP